MVLGDSISAEDAGFTPAPAPPLTTRPRRFADMAWACAVLLLLTASVWTVYGRAIHAPFVFDDYNSVLANASIKSLWPLIGSATEPGPLQPPSQFCTAGRPLVNFTLALNYHFGQLDPTGYHLFEIVLHILSGALIWGLVRRTLSLPFFGGRFENVANALALAVTVLWALHPLQSEAVIYVTQRTELMVSFCYVATLYASLRYWQSEVQPARGTWLGLATLACAAGMASKEIMVSAPIIVLAYERTFIAGSFRQAWRNSRPLYVCLAATWILLAALNFSGPRSHSTGFGSGVPAYVWWFTEAKVLLTYARLAVWPWPLVIHYEYDYLDSLSTAWPWVAPAAGIALVAALLFWRRTAIGFALLLMFAILSPTLIVPVVTEVAAERRMYLPLAALVAIAVTVFYRLLARLADSRARDDANRARPAWPLVLTLFFCGGIATVGSVAAARRAMVYNDPLMLWQDALAHQPNSSSVRINLGMMLTEAGRLPEAITQFEAAWRLKPDAADAANNLGMALIRCERPAEAIEPLEKAVSVEPDFAEAHNNLGVALGQLGREQESIYHLEEAVKLRPDYVEAHMNLGLAMARHGQPAAAAQHLELALQARPNLLMAYQPLVAAYVEQGRPAAAAEAAQRALVAAQAQGDTELSAQISAWLAEHGTNTQQP
jgi:tetratricopeptide (TPR) repeat protein